MFAPDLNRRRLWATAKCRGWLRGWGPQEVGVACAVVVLSAIIATVNPHYLTLENTFDLVSNYAFLGILAVGLLVVLISGGIDISFIAIAAVSQYVMACVLVQFGGGVSCAILIVVSAGTALGLLNAIVIYYLRIPSIVVTIATMNIYYGLLIVFSGGRWIYNLPTWFHDLGQQKVLQLVRDDGTVYGLSVTAVVFLVTVALTAGLLKYTMLGRTIYALGGNPVAARRVGFRVLLIQLFVYGYMGLLAGVAGMVHALNVQTVAPNALVGRELGVFAAVVLGGATLSGGVGTLRGTVVGVALVAVVSNSLTLTRVPAVWNQVAIGLIILISVTVTACRSFAGRSGETAR